jgi:hypothetical protein
MDRLTQRDGVCVKAIGGIANCIRRLAEYEDLGFTPENIVYMADFYKTRTSAEYIANDMRIVAKLLEAEQKEAHWIEHKWAEEDNGLLISNYECSNCHTWKREKSDYCPDCGCKMTEVK